MPKAKANWDDESNEASNSFVSWGEVGDFILGTLTAVREVASTLPDRVGEMQKVYEFKVAECRYHLLDEKKNPIEPAEEPQKGEIISVGGRKTIDSRMQRAKIGQVVGLKFVEELPAKTKGYNATKLIKVFFPKNADGTPEMDEEWLESQKEEKDF